MERTRVIVVKVGGSLFDHPRLGPGLRAYLDSLAPAEVLLVPGGGIVADAVRTLDRIHSLGEEASHWLAVQAMALTAKVVEQLITPGELSSAPTGPQIVAQTVRSGATPPKTRSPEGATHAAGCVAPSGLHHSSSPVTQGLRPGLLSAAPLGRREDGRGGVRILDCLTFMREDESRPDALPHSWDVTSDSIAARAAVVYGAERLVLLKSVDVPSGMSWEEAAARGWVDPHFPKVVAGASFAIEAVNFRRVLDSLPV